MNTCTPPRELRHGLWHDLKISMSGGITLWIKTLTFDEFTILKIVYPLVLPVLPMH